MADGCATATPSRRGCPHTAVCIPPVFVLCCRYDHVTPQRKHLLHLLNVTVMLYLCTAVYIICLYGGCRRELELLVVLAVSHSHMQSFGMALPGWVM